VEDFTNIPGVIKLGGADELNSSKKSGERESTQRPSVDVSFPSVKRAAVRGPGRENSKKPK